MFIVFIKFVMLIVSLIFIGFQLREMHEVKEGA